MIPVHVGERREFRGGVRRGGVRHVCVSFLFPLPYPLRPQRLKTEGRKPEKHETRSAALDNVHEEKKKKQAGVL